ncbi:hypothetical protein FB45DRAFT_1022883 [Roridomyces roridus]|uniref:Uncharacterized protein n=1 Tax=Roridomyces roridus TaxID=1738132 RepID=A0AAD7C994_9AGAR|nr:hypothetical protein FB45DRAFT_1022883 [Roridomyces roridus]
MYTAEIVGLQTPITVALITGPGAEEQWKGEVALYSNIRHPNLFHLYGITSGSGIHALIFYDDLAPWREFYQQYDSSHFSEVFFYTSMKTQIQVATQHVQHISGRQLGQADYTVWIRPSKGVLHIELTPPESQATVFTSSDQQCTPLLIPSSSLLNPPHPSRLMSSISLESYQDIWYSNLCDYRWLTAPTGMQIQLGSIFYVPNLAEGGKLDEAHQVAGIQAVDAAASFWCTEDAHVYDVWHPILPSEEGTFVFPESGWIRVDSACVRDTYCLHANVDPAIPKAWMTQASHIFASLGIQKNRHNYVFFDCLRLMMHFSGSPDNLPPGYLFLFPQQVDRCPAYWSIDPFGVERLTPEEAVGMGFPEFQLDMKILVLFWLDELYAAMREVHAAKGYDPDTLDVAKDLGYPLYKSPCETEELHAYLRDFGTRASIEVVDSAPDETSVAEEENGSAEDDSMVPHVFLSEAELIQLPARAILVIYVHLGLIVTCFALTLCGF